MIGHYVMIGHTSGVILNKKILRYYIALTKKAKNTVDWHKTMNIIRNVPVMSVPVLSVLLFITIRIVSKQD